MISRFGAGVLVLIIGAILIIYSYSIKHTPEKQSIGEAIDEIVGSDEKARKDKEHDDMVMVLLVSGIVLVVAGGSLVLYRGMRK